MKYYILTEERGYGWHCYIEKDEKIIYRGGFWPTFAEAMEMAIEWEGK